MATTKRHINATPEAIFEVLGNGWLFPSWFVDASRIRGVDPSWPAPGSKLHHSFGVWPVIINDTTSVLEWEPASRIKLQARGWPIGQADVTLDITPQGDGSHVRMQ